MAKLLYTVADMVREVRDLTDEENTDSISDQKILSSLNRGQTFAFDIYARVYPEPILEERSFPLTGGQAVYSTPEDIFEDRILKVSMFVPSGSGRGTNKKVTRISFVDLDDYRSLSISNIPYYYCCYNRSIEFIPTPSGTYSAKIWVLRQLEKLVLPQGRVTRINSAANYVILDSTGSDLTTEADQLGSYVNIIDGQTGLIKGSLQIQSIQENKITFRSSPMRSSVLNRTILGELPSDVSEDDYLCAVEGTCVPYYAEPTCNFLVNFTSSEMTRSLGGSVSTEEEILKKFEQQCERTRMGRERQTRVQKRNQAYGVPTRRWIFE